MSMKTDINKPMPYEAILALPYNKLHYKPSMGILSYYIYVKCLPDDRWCGVMSLMYHYTIHVDIHEMGYEDRWCIDTQEHAIEALRLWDGKGEPLYWHRHPISGRRRDIHTGREWVEK